MENGKKPAYPVLITDPGGSTAGLTKREYFAGLAMQGILSNSVLLAEMQKDYGADVDNQIAYNAIETADALLKALETKTE